MCHKWLHWRKRLVRTLLQYSDITAIVLGMLPYNFYHQINTATANVTAIHHRAHRTGNVQKAITLLHIVAVLATMFGGIVLFTQTSMVVAEYYDEKPVSDFINELHSALSMIAVIVILSRNWLHSSAYMQLLREIQMLRGTLNTQTEAPTFASPQMCDDVEQCHRFDWYVIAGACIRLVQNVSMVHALITLTSSFQASHVILIALVLLLCNITYCMQYQFNYGVLHIYRYTWTLNRRLQRIVQSHWQTCYATSYAYATLDVLEINGALMRLHRWSEQLMQHYDWQLLMIICLYVNSNAMNMYNFCVVWSGRIHTLTFDAVFSFMQIVIVNFADFWYMIDVCELTLNETRRTSGVLCGLLERKRYLRQRRALERNVEILSLMRCCRPMRFSVKGMFVLNHDKGYKMFLVTLTYFIVLVQYDFLNM